MKRLLLVIAACLPGLFSSAQCTTTNATSCTCPTTGATDCDLLPDIVVSRDALTNSGGYTEYPQFSAGTSQASQGADDGRLRLNGSTPNIGFGPIEVRGASKWVCGTDTFTTYPGAGGCPGGTDPKQVVMQRIYHKNGTLMQYSDRVAGTMTYHPTHGHQHVNGWGVYTLRLQNPNEPDPTKWPIVGRGSKLAYCLLDLSSCNSSTGYCRDSVNTVLNSTNLPNYGLGGGAYGCSNTLQGISAGYVDTYSKSLDGMWVNIPLGTCNGTYYIVIEIDPNNNFREQNENNNVMAVPITLTRQNASGTGVAEITADRAPVISAGDAVTLWANAGYSYLWSTGATTQTITVTTAGSYSVTVNGPCGTATSAPYQVTVAQAPAAPTTTSSTLCGSGSATLTAQGSGTINWYTTSTGGTPVFTGNSFTTPQLTSSTTYYAENVNTTVQPVNSTGPASNTIGTGAYYTGTTNQYLVFNAYSRFILQTVRVYAGASGSKTFILYDKDMSTTRSTTVSLAAGVNVVTLNWDVPAGDFYRLQVSGAANLYYSTSGVSYPYTVPGILQIHNSSGGHSQYFYCYDWKVKSPDIVQTSSRTPATVSIGTNGPTVSCAASNVINCTVLTSTVTVQATPSSGSTITGYAWNTGETTSSITVTSGGTYTVTVSQSNGCSVTSSATVLVDNCIPSVSASNNGPITCTNPLRTVSATATACPNNTISYSWSTGSTVASFSTSTTGTYTVTVTQSNGCTASASTVLSANITPPVVSCAALQAITCSSPTATISANATASAGNSVTGYSWSPGGQTTASINVNNGNQYTVVVTQSNGCTASTSCSAAVDTCRPTVSASNNGPITCTNSIRTVSANGIACNSRALSYLWSNGANTASFNTSAAGTYTVNVTQSVNGCTASSSTTLTASNTLPTVTFSGLASSYADNAGPATLTGSPSGGTFSGTGISGNQFYPSVAGVGGPYSITYSFTDLNGCTGSQTQTTSVYASQTYNCGVPTNLTATNITGTTAIIGWSYATAPSFRLRYRKTGSNTYLYKTFSPATGVFTYQLTGLKRNTSYEVTLQTTCTSGSSAFSLPVTFRTTSATVRLTAGSGAWSENQNCLLYPNPASDVLYFACDNLEESTVVKWEIYDVVGKLMTSGSDNLGQIDVSQLAKGTYLLKLSTEDASESIRFIRQ